MPRVDASEVLLSVVPSLRDLPEPLDRLIRTQLERVSIPRGTTIFDVGSPCELFLVLAEGVIRVVASGESGREILLYRVHPREACVLTVGCLLGSATYPARGMAEEDVQAVSFPKDLFNRLLAEVPGFRTFVFELLGRRMIDLMVALENLAFLRLDQRLATALLKQRGAAGSDDLSVTHQQLADDLGSSREVISRALESMREQGLVQLRRGGIKVLDPVGLGRRAESRIQDDALTRRRS